MSITSARMTANRENAQQSTGPRTPEGKQRASLNATRHGLTSQVVVLPHEDMQAYLALHGETLQHWDPQGIHEQRLVQRLVDTDWRLNRCPSLEHGLFAVGHRAASASNASACHPPIENENNENPELDATLTAARVLREDHQVLESIGRHETRLSRLYQSTLKELKETQHQRQFQDHGEMIRAVNLYKTSKMKGLAYDPASDGFVLKNDQIEAWMARDQRQKDASLACSVRFHLPQFQRVNAAY